MNMKRIMLYLFLLFQVILLSGCPDVALSPASKTEGSPNTFTVRPITFARSEKVTRVVVFIENKDERKPGETQWEVVAVRPIPAKNFRVTVGICPEGYKQIVPSEGEYFTPLKGQGYLISIATDAPGVYPLSTRWTAE
jgi:hypothetical protein